MPAPLVAIVIPYKDRLDCLRQTVASVQAQTCPDFVCALVDDGSTDGAAEFARQTASRDARFYCLSTDVGNRGANPARNLGWRSADAPYVIFLDSDDLLAPNCLANRLQAMEQCPGLDWAAFYGEYFDSEPGDRQEIIHFATVEDALDRTVGMRLFFQSTGIFWKRSMLEAIDGWNETLPSWQDWDVQLKAMIHFPRYAIIPTIDFHYRNSQSQSRITGTKFRNRDHLKRFVELLEEVRQLLESKGMLTSQRRDYLAGDALYAMRHFLYIHERRLARWTWDWAWDAGLLSRKSRRLGLHFIRTYSRPLVGKLCYSLFWPLLEAQPGMRFVSLLAQLPRTAIDPRASLAAANAAFPAELPAAQEELRR